MVLHVLKPVLQEKFYKMDYVFALEVNFKSMENVLILQHVNQVLNGMESNVNKSFVILVLHIITLAVVAKPQLINALLVPIGMVSDVFILLTYVLMV